MKTSNPNIFNYATSELSQDAYICWVLEGLNHPGCEIYPFSRKFLALLMQETTRQLHQMHSFSPDDVVCVDIKRQKDHIDILATLHIRNGWGEFRQTMIIEDKTFTGPHGDQLFRYKSKYAEEQPICIYYKTGFLFNDAEYAKLHGYATVHKRQMIELMRKHAAKINSDIYSGYLGHLRGLKDAEDVIADAFSEFLHRGTGRIDQALETAEGQFMLMGMLMSADSIIRHRRNDGHPPQVYDKISRGFNRDGSPWTQYTVLFHPESEAVRSGAVTEEDVFEDEIFFRIDKKSKGYYVSLRQYNKQGVPDRKLDDRLPRLRNCFVEACKAIEDDRRSRFSQADQAQAIIPSFEAPGNRGKYESEIALYYIKDSQGLRQMCELLGVITDQFVKNIRNEF